MISLGFSASKQGSTSYSGLRGTPYFDQIAGNVGKLAGATSKTALEYQKSPFGFFQGQSVNELAPVGPNGLPPEVGNALSSYAGQMFNKASAGGAMRGQVTPENTQGIVGSSLNNIGQFLTPYIMDYAKYRQQLPEQLMASRLGFLQNTIGSLSSSLGSESKYSGSSFGANAGWASGGKS